VPSPLYLSHVLLHHIGLLQTALPSSLPPSLSPSQGGEANETPVSVIPSTLVVLLLRLLFYLVRPSRREGRKGGTGGGRSMHLKPPAFLTLISTLPSTLHYSNGSTASSASCVANRYANRSLSASPAPSLSRSSSLLTLFACVPFFIPPFLIHWICLSSDSSLTGSRGLGRSGQPSPRLPSRRKGGREGRRVGVREKGVAAIGQGYALSPVADGSAGATVAAGTSSLPSFSTMHFPLFLCLTFSL